MSYVQAGLEGLRSRAKLHTTCRYQCLFLVTGNLTGQKPLVACNARPCQNAIHEFQVGTGICAQPCSEHAFGLLSCATAACNRSLGNTRCQPILCFWEGCLELDDGAG